MTRARHTAKNKKNPKSRISPFEPNIIDRLEMKGSED